MEEKKQPIGLLFGSIAYYEPSQIPTLIENLSHEQALYFLSEALEFAHKNGIYTILEAEVISKSIRSLKI